MITIESIVTPSPAQWKSIIMGLRNPMNSWAKSDSTFDEQENKICLGNNDLKLIKNLSKAGADHAKFLRMINVSMDITAPLYWVAEHDTYKVGTVRNSCSFMHKGVSKPFEITDFSITDNVEMATWKCIINTLNSLRKEYLDTRNDELFLAIRQLLPQGYMVRYTWSANYAVLKNIYYARRNHRLPEWHDFCDMCLTLPYFKDICVEE